MDAQAKTAQLQEAAARLRGRRFMRRGDDSVSLLLPGQQRLLLWQRDAVRAVRLEEAGDDVAALHAWCYRHRPDAGALALLTPRWSLLHDAALPTLFDEQARHLGAPWQPRQALAARLRGGGNAGLHDGRLLVLGVTLKRLVFNAELFEKCAQAHALAAATGQRVQRLPWWVRRIAGSRLRADQRRAAASHAAGEDAAELQAY
jgi:ribulose-5-phosphate 4-epimerase/fuculose-1-phosphate aldolase